MTKNFEEKNRSLQFLFETVEYSDFKIKILDAEFIILTEYLNE